MDILEQAVPQFQKEMLLQTDTEFYNNPLVLKDVTSNTVQRFQPVFREMILSAKERGLAESSVSSNIKGALSSWVR